MIFRDEFPSLMNSAFFRVDNHSIGDGQVITGDLVDVKAVRDYCLDKKRVKEAWNNCENKANKDYTYGDADNMQIALFNEWLKKEIK